MFNLDKVKQIKKVSSEIKTVTGYMTTYNVSNICLSLLGFLYCYDNIDGIGRSSDAISSAQSTYDALVAYNQKNRLPAPQALDLSELKSQKTKYIIKSILSGAIALVSTFQISSREELTVDIVSGRIAYEIIF
jgi:hypothetical protein